VNLVVESKTEEVGGSSYKGLEFQREGASLFYRQWVVMDF
jgi:hypothetical protein